MVDELSKFIADNFGLSFFIGVVVAAGLIQVIIWFVKTLLKHKNIENKIKGLPCVEHRNSIDKQSDKLDNISSSLSTIAGQVELLVKMATSVPSKQLLYTTADFSEKRSPRKLNANGDLLFSDIEGERFLDENGAFLLDEIAKLNPKTALDVENMSLSVLRVNSDKDFFVRLKNWVYNAPAREIVKEDGSTINKDITFDDVLFVISLPLRDRYLAGHPEISVE